MERPHLVAGVVLWALACAGPITAAPPATAPPPVAEVTDSGAPTVAAAAPAPACGGPEARAFDFWVGTWDLVVRARAAPDSESWSEARGTQHVERILGGCVIAEHFRAEGPGSPWAGESLSVWVPRRRQWRQTWVDDSGNYLAFTGGIQNGVMTLDGEPFERDGQHVRMRMVFLDVTAGTLRWEWQRSNDGGATWRSMMVILYTRRL